MKRFLVVGLCCCCAGLLFAEDGGADGKGRTFKRGDEVIVSISEKPGSTYQVTAKIVEVLANGMLKIYASRPDKTYEMEGVIDPKDISSKNQIRSGQIANLSIIRRSAPNVPKLDEQESSPSLELPVGVRCTVHVSRGHQHQVLSGTIHQINSQWLVLKTGHRRNRPDKDATPAAKLSGEQWIPRGAILYVSVKRNG